MKKLFLVLLMMLSGSAWAEWQLVSSVKDGEVYLHYGTIRKDGNMRKSWSLQNLTIRGKNGELSRRIRLEHDCKNERYRMMTITSHSEPMAEGDMLFNDSLSNPQWKDIAPDTSMATILEIVCAK